MGLRFNIGDDVRVFCKEPYVGKDGICKIIAIDITDPNLCYRVEKNGTRFWVRAEDVVAPNETRVVINLEDKASAHKAIEEAIESFKKAKRGWTFEEIKKAEAYLSELLLKYVMCGKTPYFEDRPATGETTLYTVAVEEGIFSRGFCYKHKVAVARATGEDVYDRTIGRVVCLCKALGCDVPDFIKEKNN